MTIAPALAQALMIAAVTPLLLTIAFIAIRDASNPR